MCQPRDVLQVGNDSCPALVLKMLVMHQSLTLPQLFLAHIMKLLHAHTQYTRELTGMFCSNLQ